MAITERTLEENEAKIDNILHKVLLSVQGIKELNEQMEGRIRGLSDSEAVEFLDARTRRIKLLADILENLIVVADLIDIKDERLTKEIEHKIKDQLSGAIERISEAQRFLE